MTRRAPTAGDPPRPRVAFWFRYGPAEHTELLHALPDVIERLARGAEVHYFGLRSQRPVPERIARAARVHLLPLTVHRTSSRDKFLKTALWLLLLPWIALRSRLLGIDAVYIDETIPFTTQIGRLFFGRRVAVTVVDFFVDIYLSRPGLVGRIGRAIRAADLRSWRRLPLIFTRARSTRDYLVGQGLDGARIRPAYDPCDLSIYHPADRAAARRKLGIPDDAVVLVHHGILHPNKGNDRILQAIAPLKVSHPQFRYLLVGDGPEMANLRAQAKALGLEDRVIFTGWLPALDQVNEALNAGDIGLVMRVGAESDNFHMTGALVHSLACGLPVLAAKLAGVSEVTREDENGLLFPPADMEMFRAKLIRLIEDPAARRRMGAAALATAREHFDMERFTEHTAQALLDLARK